MCAANHFVGGIARKMSKLRISLVQERPDQVYYAGGVVQGHLLLEVNKPKSYKTITVHFTGRSHVSLSNSRRSSETSGKNKASTSTEPYIDLLTVLWDGKEHPDGKLTPGQHSWPFSFFIPQTVPSSFEGTYGSIRYVLEGKITASSSKSNQTVETPLPVKQLVVYADPALLRQQHQVVTKRMKGLCCTSRSVVLHAKTPKTTFYPGETCELDISLENGSGRHITLSVLVKQDSRFSASNGTHKWEGKTAATVANTEVEPRSTRDWSPTIEVPEVDVVDEGSCDNIKVTHSLVVNCKISRTENLFTVFPLKISNWRPVESAPVPSSNPEIGREGYILASANSQTPATVGGVPLSPHTFPSAQPSASTHPPTGIPHNFSLPHQASPTAPAVQQYTNSTAPTAPPANQPHHRPLSSQVSAGGVPTPIVTAGMSHWDSAGSLSRGWL